MATEPKSQSRRGKKAPSHTPGPWHLDGGGYENWPFEGGFNGVIVSKSGKTVFAGPSSFKALCGETKSQAEANARLMAAAPELLEALQWLYAICLRDGLMPPTVSYMKNAEAAIAKATTKARKA